MSTWVWPAHPNTIPHSLPRLQDELLGLQEQQDGRGAAAQIDAGVLYRQGETASGEGTYSPRLVLWDLSGALGGVSAGDSLYRDANHSAAVVSTWAGRHEVFRAAPVAPSAFTAELESEAERPPEEEAQQQQQQQQQGGGEPKGGPTPLEAAAAQLDSNGGGGVRYWTDYLKAHLHPRSVHQLAGAWHGLTPFSSWGDGEEHWRSEQQREEMTERLRWVWGQVGPRSNAALWVAPATVAHRAHPPPRLQFFRRGGGHAAGLPVLCRGPGGLGPVGGPRAAGGRAGAGAAAVARHHASSHAYPCMPLGLHASSLTPSSCAPTNPTHRNPPQEVRDEYGTGRPVMLYALRPQPGAPPADGDPAEARRWRLNEGLSLGTLAPLCSTYTPVAPPRARGALPLLRWQPSSAYHASAVCAAALDTASLPHRLVAGEGPGDATGEPDASCLLSSRSAVMPRPRHASPCRPLPQAAATCLGSPTCSPRNATRP